MPLASNAGFTAPAAVATCRNALTMPTGNQMEGGQAEVELAQLASGVHEGDFLEVGFVVGGRRQEGSPDSGQGAGVELEMGLGALEGLMGEQVLDNAIEGLGIGAGQAQAQPTLQGDGKDDHGKQEEGIHQEAALLEEGPGGLHIELGPERGVHHEGLSIYEKGA